jgi:hypothetical protein
MFQLFAFLSKFVGKKSLKVISANCFYEQTDIHTYRQTEGDSKVIFSNIPVTKI